jgi:hypothetical protein
MGLDFIAQFVCRGAASGTFPSGARLVRKLALPGMAGIFFRWFCHHRQMRKLDGLRVECEPMPGMWSLGQACNRSAVLLVFCRVTVYLSPKTNLGHEPEPLFQ